jgi:hypothetical protein
MASLPTKKIQFHLGELTNIINEFKAACVAEKAAAGEDAPAVNTTGGSNLEEGDQPRAQDDPPEFAGKPVDPTMDSIFNSENYQRIHKR